MCKIQPMEKNHLILLFVIVSKCRLNVNSKLSLKVTLDKARLKNHSSAFNHSNGHEIKWLYSPRVGGKIVCHNLSNRRIPFNLSSKQKLVYALRKGFFKHLMKCRRAFLWFRVNYLSPINKITAFYCGVLPSTWEVAFWRLRRDHANVMTCAACT